MPEQQRFVIWGSAGHAKVLGGLIASIGGRVVALFDNCDVPSALPGVPVFIGESGFFQWLNQTGSIHTVAGLVAIGGNRGNDRIAIQNLFIKHGLYSPSVVHPKAAVCDTTSLGAGTQVLAQAVVAAGTKVGDACIINHGASVDHECMIYRGVHIAPGAILCGCVTIEENVLVGAGAVVLPRITIGKNSVIGAGSVVTRDVPENVIVAGNPARLHR